MAPTARTDFSWIARSSLTCMGSGSSATSSRNRVPPLAAWNSPGLSAWAPVKLPFLWPKNSLSISSAGIAPQLTGTKGPAARAPCSWMVRATSSLPTPDSPGDVDRGLAARNLGDGRAQLRPWARNRRAGGWPVPAAARQQARVRCSLSSSACWTRPRNTARSTGLLTKSKAPAFSASTASFDVAEGGDHGDRGLGVFAGQCRRPARCRCRRAGACR